MRKVMLAALATALLVAAPAVPAPAKTFGVDVSKKGFTPGNVTVETGDVVTFTNRDGADHQVVCQTCPFTSPVLKANQTYSYTFAKVGKFGLADPLNKNKKGTVTVTATPAPPTTVTLRATPSTVTYGQVSVMEGRLGNGGNDQAIDILATECGSKTAKLVGRGTTGTGGLYTVLTHPARRTSYQARWRTSLSPSVSVSVRPVVALKKLKKDRYSVSVLAGQSFVGKSVAIRRYVTRTKHWYTIKTITLRRRVATTTTMPGSIATVAAFAARLGRGVTIRAVLPPAQSGSCYLAASSSAVRS